MKKEITLGSLLGILVPIFVALLGWGISLSSRVELNDSNSKVNKNSIEKVEGKVEKQDDKFDKFNEKMDENFKIVIDKLDEQRREQSRNR